MSNIKRSAINQALRLVRLYWGYSQAGLAQELGISQAMISEIERGSKSVSIDVLEKYSNLLGIRMSQLLFFAEELEIDQPKQRGKLIVANSTLRLLELFAPKEAGDGGAVKGRSS